VSVIGLGYVGLPLVMALRRGGFTVIGLDASDDRVAGLNERRSYIVDVTDADLEALDRTTFTTDADVAVLCLPTPLTDGSPDLTMVLAAAEDVSEHLHSGMLVTLESTTYPGTTEEFVRPILEASPVVAGRDFALAYSPERIDPGTRGRTLANTPKIVSGVTDHCAVLAEAFYGTFVDEVVRASGTGEAEMAKLIENTFRQVNIALVNELAILAHDLDVDIWEALRLAATKPFGYTPFWPGPGVGGHCIAIDPTYLSWLAGQRLGYRVRSIEHANEINNRMPSYVASRLGEALNDAGKPVKGSKVLALGVAYKGGVDDLRESPSLSVVERLVEKGAQVSFHDPYIDEVTVRGEEMKSETLDESLIAAQDCVVILTDHPGVDYELVVRLAPLVFDTRGATLGMDAPNLVRL
jgi:UDP-N-acetyl-D-glucosamine dehydrogenase